MENTSGRSDDESFSNRTNLLLFIKLIKSFYEKPHTTDPNAYVCRHMPPGHVSVTRFPVVCTEHRNIKMCTEMAIQ